MTRRLAGCVALVAFALCLWQGLGAENSFVTVIWRALQALVVTLTVGLVIGAMLERMLAENLKPADSAENSLNSSEQS
jgi:ethanolamine transporter EutH